ncbi:cold shock domain-containing protein [Thiotrichales bacterium HSG1]|nr:cold shock domain-containing protein [Thiotrichales bacterium HSG1]
MRFIKDLLFSEENLIKRACDFSETYSSGFSVTDIIKQSWGDGNFAVSIDVRYEKYGKTNEIMIDISTNKNNNNDGIIYTKILEIIDKDDGAEEFFDSYDGGYTAFVPANTRNYTKKFTTIADAYNWCMNEEDGIMATKAIACAAYLLGKENEMLSSAEMDKSIADRKQRKKEAEIQRLQKLQELQRQKHRQEVEDEKRKKEKQRKAEQQRREYEKKFKFGNIKIFYSAKLFGFIDMNGKDVFFHFSEVVNENDPQKVLKNTKVKFIPVDSKKGLKATKVKIL